MPEQGIQKRSPFQSLKISEKSLFLIILFCFLSVLFIRVRLINIYTPNVGGIEQNVIFSCQRIGAGFPLYTNPEKPPYSFTQYSPLYFYIVGFTGKMAHLDPEEPMPWYRISRAYSLFFNLLLCFFVFITLQSFRKIHKLFALALALLIFIFFEQQDYSRPDSLYHLFFCLSVCFMVRFLQNDEIQHVVRNLFLAGLFTSMALYAKQSGIFLAGFLFVYLLVNKHSTRNLFVYLMSFLVSSGTLAILLLNEPYTIIAKNVFLGIMNGFDFKWAIKLYLLPSLPRFTFFFLLVSFMVLNWRKNQHQLFIFLSSSALFFLAVALVSGARWGSGTNYFFEFCLLTLLA
ncbi:MAG: glycosyltransferase family 39 protein, partial [Bacteroidetes bacterium]|nr:glycosyltransferase family 39 protein [Bacteroidota bacterium]